MIPIKVIGQFSEWSENHPKGLIVLIAVIIFFLKDAFAIDRLFWANAIGRNFSFAAITLWKLDGLE